MPCGSARGGLPPTPMPPGRAAPARLPASPRSPDGRATGRLDGVSAQVLSRKVAPAPAALVLLAPAGVAGGGGRAGGRGGAGLAGRGGRDTGELAGTQTCRAAGRHCRRQAAPHPAAHSQLAVQVGAAQVQAVVLEGQGQLWGPRRSCCPCRAAGHSRCGAARPRTAQQGLRGLLQRRRCLLAQDPLQLGVGVEVQDAGVHVGLHRRRSGGGAVGAEGGEARGRVRAGRCPAAVVRRRLRQTPSWPP